MVYYGKNEFWYILIHLSDLPLTCLIDFRAAPPPTPPGVGTFLVDLKRKHSLYRKCQSLMETFFFLAFFHTQNPKRRKVTDKYLSVSHQPQTLVFVLNMQVGECWPLGMAAVFRQPAYW